MAMPSTAEAEHEFECRLNSSQVLSLFNTAELAPAVTLFTMEYNFQIIKYNDL